MSAHTPGPWAIEPSWAERCDGSVAIVNREHMRDDWDVCMVHSTEANAHLIAAAPELLEALMEFVAEAEPDCGQPNCRECGGYTKARAAIAKATQP